MIKIFLFFMLVIAPSISSSEDLDKIYADKILNISAKQFLKTTMDHIGTEIRVKATLSACELDGLATAIENKTKIELKTLLKFYKSLPSDEKLDCKGEACYREMGVLSMINFLMRSSYELGYKDAIKIGIKNNPSICSAATSLANEILSKKSITIPSN